MSFVRVNDIELGHSDYLIFVNLINLIYNRSEKEMIS
jgi:hypothetical protein